MVNSKWTVKSAYMILRYFKESTIKVELILVRVTGRIWIKLNDRQVRCNLVHEYSCFTQCPTLVSMRVYVTVHIKTCTRPPLLRHAYLGTTHVPRSPTCFRDWVCFGIYGASTCNNTILQTYQILAVAADHWYNRARALTGSHIVINAWVAVTQGSCRRQELV